MFLTDCRRNDDLCRVMNHRDVQHILKIGGDSAILTAARRAFEMPEQEHNDLLRRRLADMIRRTSRNAPSRRESAAPWLRFINENHIDEQIAFELAIFKLTTGGASAAGWKQPGIF